MVASFGGNNVAVRNTLAFELKIRSDLERPDQGVLLPSVQEGIVAPLSGAPFWRNAETHPYRFMKGSTVAYLQSSFGSGTAKVRFVR